MFRVSFKFIGYARGPIPADPAVAWQRHPLWQVKKCYVVRNEALPYTGPVKFLTDHGDKRLLILSPVKVAARESHTPYEILRAYLYELPEDVKRARAAEMREAA